MRIGIDIKALHAGKAGIAVYIRNTLDRLQEIDAENEYFLFEKKPSSYRVFNPRWQKVLVPSRFPGTFWLMVVVPLHFAKYSIDVFFGPEQVIPCLYRLSGVKMVSTIHDVALFRFPQTMQTTNYFINKVFLRKSIRRSDRICSVSAFVKNEIVKFCPNEAAAEKIVVTYNGKPGWSDQMEFHKNRGDHLLFVGSLEPRKNLLNLLSALSILKTEKQIVISLHIVGPAGWKNDVIHGYVVENGLEETISFLGYLSEEELIKEYYRCRALIYPSLYEGFGLPVLESLMTNTPVLTSKGTAMEEIAGECCVLFNPEQPRDIAEKIAVVYAPGFDPQERLKYRDKVLAKFSWDTTARQTLVALTQACRLGG